MRNCKICDGEFNPNSPTCTICDDCMASEDPMKVKLRKAYRDIEALMVAILKSNHVFLEMLRGLNEEDQASPGI